MFRKTKCFYSITTTIINISVMALTYSFASVAIGKELAPQNTDADAYFQQAHVLFEQGNYKGSETLLRKVIQLNNSDSEAYYTLSFVLYHHGDMEMDETTALTFKEAEAVYQEALRLDSNDRWEQWKEWDHAGWGRILAAQGNIEGALAEYRKYIRTITYVPDRNRLGEDYASLFLLLFRNGHSLEAIAAFKEAIRISYGGEYGNGSAFDYMKMARLLLMDNYTEEAIALTQELSRVDPNGRSYYHEFLALVLYLQGQQEEVIANLRIADDSLNNEDYLENLRQMKEFYLQDKQRYLQQEQQELQERQKNNQEIIQQYLKVYSSD